MRIELSAIILINRECVERGRTMYKLREFVKGRRGVDNDPHFLLPLYSGEMHSLCGVIVTTNIGVDNGSHFLLSFK